MTGIVVLDSEYVDELFPYAESRNHGSEDDEAVMSREGGWCWLFEKVCYRPDFCEARRVNRRSVDERAGAPLETNRS